MAYFSWKTSDTGKSIAVKGSKHKTFPVYMIAPDGRVFEEKDYEGNGVFGDKDIYALIAEINQPEDCNGQTDHDRHLGLLLTFRKSPSGCFVDCEKNGLVMPRLVENKDIEFDKVGPPLSCDSGGYFWDGE